MTSQQLLSKYLLTSFFITALEAGAISDGLITARLPEAMAQARGFIVTMYGKFHDPQIRETPKGSYLILDLAGAMIRAVSTSTSVIYYLISNLLTSQTYPVNVLQMVISIPNAWTDFSQFSPKSRPSEVFFHCPSQFFKHLIESFDEVSQLLLSPRSFLSNLSGKCLFETIYCLSSQVICILPRVGWI